MRNDESQEGIYPLVIKVDAIKEKYPPVILLDIHVFLGMTGYYFWFITHFADLTKPLIHLLQNYSSFIWDEEQDYVFQDLREALASSPFIVHHDFKKPFFLFNDASDVAVEDILAQLNNRKLTLFLTLDNLYLKPKGATVSLSVSAWRYF